MKLYEFYVANDSYGMYYDGADEALEYIKEDDIAMIVGKGTDHDCVLVLCRYGLREIVFVPSDKRWSKVVR